MTTPVPTRFKVRELAVLDELVAAGVGDNRSDVIRAAVEALYDAHRRRGVGDAIAASYRAKPQSTEDVELAMAMAIALTEAEPW